MNENEVSKVIFDAGLKVHRQLGAGLLESAYEESLYYELQKSGLLIEKQKPMPLIYDDIKLDIGYRIDLLVERKVVVEIKSVESLNEIHIAQVLTYLKLSNCKLGLLINQRNDIKFRIFIVNIVYNFVNLEVYSPRKIQVF
ncbi:GxxExxY protein [Chryseobacterium mucoviscidosis]